MWIHEVAPLVGPIDVAIKQAVDWAIFGSHGVMCAQSPCSLQEVDCQKTKSGKFIKSHTDTLLLAAGGSKR